MKKIRIHMIADNRILREGIMGLLDKQPDFDITASSGQSNILEEIKKFKPDVILLDLSTQTKTSLEELKSIKKEITDAKVVVLDLFPDNSNIIDYVRAGASGFVEKDASIEELINTIYNVSRGENVLPCSMTGSLFRQIVQDTVRKGRVKPDDTENLTIREREIVDLIAKGLSNKEIAQHLCIATFTVKSHVHRILEKLALQSRLQVAAYAHGRETTTPKQEDGKNGENMSTPSTPE